MRKPISTRSHALLDYATIGKFMLLPRVMGWSKPMVRAMDCVALVKLGYTLLTRHELGAFKLLPMKAHLGMDVAGGAMIAALPFAVGDEDPATIATCAAMGAFDIIVAPLTETEMPGDNALESSSGNPSLVSSAMQQAAYVR